jgi:tight adherence protein B
MGAVAALLAFVASRTVQWGSREHRHHLEHLTEVEFAELFLFLDPVRFLQWNLMAALALPLITFIWIGAQTAAVVFSVVIVAPTLIYRVLKQRRRRALEPQLAEAASAMASSLRSGLAFGQALEQVVKHQPAPISQEFALVLREQRLGVPIDKALQGFATRVDLPDARMLVTTLAIARELGGGLAEALERYARMVRRRLALENRIRALTAQGKLQGWIMGALPIGLAAVLWWLNPNEMNQLIESPAGWAVIAVLVVLEWVGFLLIRRIVQIRV